MKNASNEYDINKVQYCGTSKCSEEVNSNVCASESDLNKACPSGYKHTGYTTCPAHGLIKTYYSKHCSTDPTSNRWDILADIYEIEKTENSGQTLPTATGKKLAKCCRGEISPTDDDYEKCGFHIPDNKNICDNFYNEYCLIPENLKNDPKCIDHISKNVPKFSTELTKICSNKDNYSEFNDACGCFYSKPYYDRELIERSDTLGVKPGIFDANRKCFSHACQDAIIKNNPDDVCKNTTINVCKSIINNVNSEISAGQSAIFNQICNITTNPGDTKADIIKNNPLLGLENSSDPKPDPTDIPPKKNNNKLLFLLIMIIVIICGALSYLYVTWDDAEEARLFY
jgi:hypothetical protein